jgi:hypothetical protein
MRSLPWLFYILAGVLAIRDFLGKVTSHMKFHTLLRSFGNGYSSVVAEIHYCVTYDYVDGSGLTKHCIETVRSDRQRLFRIKGDWSPETVLQLVECELVRRIKPRFDLVHSVRVQQATNISEWHTPVSKVKYVSDAVRDEMLRIEFVFMGLPRNVG